MFIVPVVTMAQSSTSLQRITVTSVTIFLDSLDTPTEAEMVKTAITKHTEVKDFDLKKTNCNFTIDNTNNTLDAIFSDLEQHGQPVRVYSVEASQIFTRVAEENCLTKREEELKEEEYLRQHPELKNKKKEN
ncbi:MAG: hypothetical protein U0176_07080 [Bacteroidia bacterium]